ncbi:MAG: YciI family protein [Woeseiaceae bacterium]
MQSFYKIQLLMTVLCVMPGATLAEEPAVAESLSWFAVEISVGPGWDESISPYEQAYFKEHSAHLAELRQAGHIVMGARYSDVGLLVIQALAAEDVRDLMDGDPSMQAGTFQYSIYPMNIFYPGFVGKLK